MKPNPKKKLWIETESKEIKDKILNSGYSKTFKQNLLRIYEEVRNEVFGNSRIVQTINCSEVTATSYIKRMIEFIKEEIDENTNINKSNL